MGGKHSEEVKFLPNKHGGYVVIFASEFYLYYAHLIFTMGTVLSSHYTTMKFRRLPFTLPRTFAMVLLHVPRGKPQ